MVFTQFERSRLQPHPGNDPLVHCKTFETILCLFGYVWHFNPRYVVPAIQDNQKIHTKFLAISNRNGWVSLHPDILKLLLN